MKVTVFETWCRFESTEADVWDAISKLTASQTLFKDFYVIEEKLNHYVDIFRCDIELPSILLSSVHNNSFIFDGVLKCRATEPTKGETNKDGTLKRQFVLVRAAGV